MGKKTTKSQISSLLAISCVSAFWGLDNKEKYCTPKMKLKYLNNSFLFFYFYWGKTILLLIHRQRKYVLSVINLACFWVEELPRVRNAPGLPDSLLVLSIPISVMFFSRCYKVVPTTWSNLALLLTEVKCQVRKHTNKSPNHMSLGVIMRCIAK